MALGARLLPARGRERPDYTIFTYPAGNLADASTEEIELDQALSLQGRRGRDFLGVISSGPIGQMAVEHLTIAGADHAMRFIERLQTRTGSFGIGDPELIHEKNYHAVNAAGATDTATVGFTPTVEESLYGEPELYVAPRLFWRQVNDIDAQINAGAMNARIATVAVKLTFPLFIELLERFADVTLL